MERQTINLKQMEMNAFSHEYNARARALVELEKEDVNVNAQGILDSVPVFENHTLTKVSTT